MATAKAKAQTKKAQVRADKAALETKKAAQDSAKAIRDLTVALVEQLRGYGFDERAQELANRIMESDAVGRTKAKGRELTELAKQKIEEAGLDERASELASRLRESEKGQQAAQRARQVSDQRLERAGQWLASGKAGEKLGVQQRRRTWPVWVLALVGVAAGYAIGMLTAPKRGQELREDLVQRRSGLKDELGATRDDLATAAERMAQDTADVSAPPAEGPLEDRIRTALGQDRRTSDLPRLNVNVVEGTVFIRGTVPAGYDENAIREVVAEIPGVADVDLQVTAST